jgi:hypothetical protein
MSPSTTSTVAPFGVTARAFGAWPTGIGRPARSVEIEIGVTVFDP